MIPPLPSVTRGVPTVLGADPKGKNLLYCNGASVILRNLKDPRCNDVYTQHAKKVNVAKYSPSGFYIASADDIGKVRIWDTVNPEHVLKNEYSPFSGPVYDLSWSSDNQWIFVGGCGRSLFGAIINAETGSSVGSIMGISKKVNSVDIRPTRPFRLIMGDDEGLVSFFEGPPFKFKLHTKYHTSFVQVVRFSPTGSIFISAGSDGKIFVYNATDSALIGEVGSPAHGGGIYGVSFSKDGSRFVSGSGDKKIKLWKVEGESVTPLSEYNFGTTLNDMILGCSWVDDLVAAVTLNGSIHLFDAPTDTNTLMSPRVVYTGHTGFLTCGHYNVECSRLLTGSNNAVIASWDLESASAQMFTGDLAHKSHISNMTSVGDVLITIGFDDRCVLSNIKERTYLTSINLPSQPHSVGVMPQLMLVVIGCDKHVVLLNASNNKLQLLDQKEIALGKSYLTVSPETGTAIICAENEQLMAFKTCGGKLSKLHVTNPPPRPPTMGAYSPDGSMIVFVDASRNVTVHKVTDDAADPHQMPTLQPFGSEYWQRHSASITALGWSPNGRRIATGSLDTSIIIWSLDTPRQQIVIRDPSLRLNSISLSWIDNSTLCNTAADGSIRSWNVPI